MMRLRFSRFWMVFICLLIGCKESDHKASPDVSPPPPQNSLVARESSHVTGSTLPMPDTIPAVILKIHGQLVKKLPEGVLLALSAAYPDARIVRVCPGHFGDSAHAGWVLGVWKHMEAQPEWKRDLHRFGFVWKNDEWRLHVIDDEIQQDDSLSRVGAMSWFYSIADTGFLADMRCGVDLKKDSAFSLNGEPLEKPLFNLTIAGLASATPVCFQSDDIFNNWDCLVYDPKLLRFRLWYQQVFFD